MRFRLAAAAFVPATLLAIGGCSLIVGLEDHYGAIEAGVVVVHDEGGFIVEDGGVIFEEAGPVDAFVPPPSPLVLACADADAGWRLDCSFGVGACVNAQFPAASAPVMVAIDGGFLLAGSVDADASTTTYLSELSAEGALQRFASTQPGSPDDVAVVPPFDSQNFSDATCPLYATLDTIAAAGAGTLSVDLYSAPLRFTTTRVDDGVGQEPVRLLSSSLTPPHPVAVFLTNFDDVDGSAIPGTTTIDLYAMTGTEFSHVPFEDPRADGSGDAGDASGPADAAVRFGRARAGVSLDGGTWVVGEESAGVGSALYILDGTTRGAVQTFGARLDDVATLPNGDAVAVGPTDGGITFQVLASSGAPGGSSAMTLQDGLASDALHLVTTDATVLAVGVTQAQSLAVFEAAVDPDGGAPHPRIDLPNAGVSLVPIGHPATIGSVRYANGALYVGLRVTTPAAPYAIVVRLVR